MEQIKTEDTERGTKETYSDGSIIEHQYLGGVGFGWFIAFDASGKWVGNYCSRFDAKAALGF